MEVESDEEVHSEQEGSQSGMSDQQGEVCSDEEEEPGPESPRSDGVVSPSSPQGSATPDSQHSPVSGGEDYDPSSPISQDGSAPTSPHSPPSPDSPAASNPNVLSSPTSQEIEEPISPTNPEGQASPSQVGNESGDEDDPSSPIENNVVGQSPHLPNEATPHSDHSDDERNSIKEDSDAEDIVREDAPSDKEERSERDSDSKRGSNTANNSVPEENMPNRDKDGPLDDSTSVHSEIEDRASIHSDNEEQHSGAEKKSGNVSEDQRKSGSGHSSDSDSDVNIRKPRVKSKGRSVESDSDRDSNEEEQDEEEEDEEDKARVGELIADIFGESDDDEEFEGFAEEEVATATKKPDSKKPKSKVLSDSEDEAGDANNEDPIKNDILEEQPDSDDGVDDMVIPKKKKKKQVSRGSDNSDDEGVDRENALVSDFELMMQRKKEESGQRRKKKGYDIINDSDDLIADILNQMKVCADEDRVLNKNRQAATKKLKLLPLVVSQLKKLDLKVAFLDQGALSIMTEWLSPLPDRSLPHLHIREHLLRLLAEFPPIDQSALKASGIGRAVMYLYKHPRETKDNREKAGKLISEWSRPIFNVNTNYHSISKEEREKRDFEHMPKKRKLRLETGDENPRDIDRAFTGDEKSLRPGDKGWVGRARVPLPSTKDYVVRPKWNIETDISKSSGRKQMSRLDKHVRNFSEKKKAGRMQRAVSISIEGRKMAL